MQESLYKTRMLRAINEQQSGGNFQVRALEDSSATLRIEMRGSSLNNVCHCGLFTYLVLFSSMSFTAAVSFDLTELRNNVAKIKVNPRGNLWATGHFMGKKSVMDAPRLHSVEGPGGDALMEDNIPAEQSTLVGLLQQFLRVALQTQLVTPERHSRKQEANLLMKILDSYIQNRK